MAVIIVTGSGGLIGAEAARRFHQLGFDIVGIDNDMRAAFFGVEASTQWAVAQLQKDLPRYRHHKMDIRDRDAVEGLFKDLGPDVAAIIHTAAQPSHDWAARDPHTDFTVNANGTLVLLEAMRQFCPTAPFLFTSTNKVYGDLPNKLPLVEKDTRWEIATDHAYFDHGIDEAIGIDNNLHSLFGASKASADLLVQEYGRYFGLPTLTLRGGCLTGAGHSGTELHGFLAYLMRCVVEGRPYRIFGYKGKQVRDNIHSADLVACFEVAIQTGITRPGQAYNMGGGRFANCSMLEAIELCQQIAGKKLDYSYEDDNRIGDHIWYISDTRAFERDYPAWNREYDLDRTLRDIFEGIEIRCR